MPMSQNTLPGLITCLILAASPVMADEKAAAQPEGTAAPAVVCTNEKPTGSRRVVKVCRTAADMAEDETGSKRVVDRAKHYGNAGLTPPGG
jgi:hypothetical protein